MTTTISHGRMLRVTVAVDDARLRAMRKAPEVAQAAVMQGADYWHTGILPRHFDKSAHGRYGYANRAKNYLANHGKGTKPDLVFSGSLRRDLLARAAFRAMGGGTELKMSARVLNFVPRMAENDEDFYVKHRNRSYPNLKREIKAILEDEREAVAAVVCGSLEKAFAPSDEQV